MFDRIDEERELAPSLRIGFGGALHLPGGEFDAHLGQDLARLFEVYVAG